MQFLKSNTYYMIFYAGTYVELEVLQRYTADLALAIAANPSLFGQHLVQHGLAVQITVAGIVDTLGITDYQKGSILLSLVDSKLRTAGTRENATKYFNDFLLIIAYPMGHRDLAELVVATFSKLSAHKLMLCVWNSHRLF